MKNKKKHFILSMIILFILVFSFSSFATEYGEIGAAVISTHEWNQLTGVSPTVVRLNNSEYYLIVSAISGSDGGAITLQVWNDNGTIRSMNISYFEYDTSQGHHPWVVQIPETDKYVISYGGAAFASLAVLQAWDSNGTIRQVTIDTQLLSYPGDRTCIVKMPDTNVYATVYRNTDDSDGFLETTYIRPTGEILGINDTVEYDGYNGINAKITTIDTDTVAIVYKGNDSDGFICTFNISATGDITNTPSERYEFDTTNGESPDIKHVYAATYAIAYQGTGADGFVKTLNISDDGAVDGTWIDSLTFETSNSYYPYLFSVNDPENSVYFPPPPNSFELLWTSQDPKLVQGAGFGPAVADIDNDGTMEVLTSGHNDTGTDRVFCFNAEDGSLQWRHVISGYTQSHCPMEVTDINNDGLLEIFQPSPTLSTMIDSNGVLIWKNTSLWCSEAYQLILDADSNNHPYLYTCNADDSYPYDAKLRKVNATTGKEITSVSIWYPCHGGLAASDIDSDGHYELFMSDRNTGNGKGIQCYSADDLTLIWSRPDIGCSSMLPNIIDVDGDSILDVLILQERNNDAGVYCLDAMTGLDIPGMCQDTVVGLPSHESFPAADLDDDGDIELTTSCSTQPNTKVFDLGSMSIVASLAYSGKSPIYGNVYGDEKPEIILSEEIDGIKIYDGSDYSLIATIPGASYGATIQDINNDGYNEIITKNRSGVIKAYTTTGVAHVPLLDTGIREYGIERQRSSPGGLGAGTSVEYTTGIWGINGVDSVPDPDVGKIYTFNISSSGVLGDSLIDSFTVDTSFWTPHTIYLGKNNYMSVYEGTNNDGWAATFTIGTNWASPEFSAVYPADGSIDVEANPRCSIMVNDTNNDTCNIYFYENTTGEWIRQQVNSSVTNGTYYWLFTNASSGATKYYWKVSCFDGTHNTTSDVYTFTTFLWSGSFSDGEMRYSSSLNKLAVYHDGSWHWYAM